MKKIWWILLVCLLSGCAGINKVGPGAHVVKDTLAVNLDGPWNRLDFPGMGKQEIWTLEGVPLDTLRFYVAVKDGEVLFENNNLKGKQLPKFQSSMRAQEVVQLVESSLSADGSAFKLQKVAAATFAGEPGFRFEFTLLRKSDEVELRGLGYGGVHQGALSLVVFSAPKVHYYAKVAPRAEAVISSARYVSQGGKAAPSSAAASGGEKPVVEAAAKP